MATSVVGELAIWNNTSQSAVTNARPPYVLIAGATGVTAKVKAMAEYVCDGVADQVEINAALAVDDKRPILLAGQFTTSAAITFTDGVKHDLMGWNEDYASITANHTGNALEIHSTLVPQEWRVTIANLKIGKGTSIPARGISIQNGAFLMFRNVLVSHMDSGTGIYGYFCNTNVFENCTIADCATGLELTGIPDQASHHNTVRSCYFRFNTSIGVKITDRAHGNHWEGCTFEYGTTGVAVQTVAGSSETNGQTWTCCWFEGNNSAGILDLQGGSDLIFDRCRFAPQTTSHPVVKVSGFGATGVTIIDPIVSNPATFTTLPAAVAVVDSGNPTTVDVRSFGATGNGTTDDRAAIQRAIDHLGTTGGIVTGPLGTYLLTQAGVSDGLNQINYCLRVTIDAVHGPITLDFPRGTVFKLANAQPTKSVTFLVDGTQAAPRVSPTTLRGITFHGNTQGSQPAWIDFGAITAIYSSDILIEACTISYYNFAGIHVLRDCRGVRIRDCFFDGTFNGITAPSEGTRPMLRIEIQDLVVDGCRFVTDAAAGQHAITMGDNADYHLQGRGMRITNNVIAGGRNGAMLDMAGVTHCYVAGNFFRDMCDLSGTCINIAQYTNPNGTYWEGAHNVVENNIFFNVRQGITLGGNAGVLTSVNYTTGAFSNIVRNNIITRDFDTLRSELDGGGSYPDRFSPAPNAAAVNLLNGILENGQDLANGTATSATSTTLVDSTKTMGTTAFVNYILVITGGTGKGQWRQITSHTNTTFTVPAWDVTPDTTSTYRVTALVGHNEISGNIIVGTNTSSVGIKSTGWLPSTFSDNRIYQSSAVNAVVVGTVANNPNAIVYGNKAWANGPGLPSPQAHTVYQDESSGTASITSAATTVTVTHRLGRTPTSDQIMVWPITTLGTAAKWWVDTPTSTTFVINVDAAPGATVTFGWRAFGSR